MLTAAVAATPPPTPDGERGEVAVEQRAVDVMYARLDELRRRVDAQLRRVRRAGPSGTPQNRSERDAFATEYERRLAQLWAVEERLMFGRLDLRGGEVLRIGRIGLSDDDQRQLLVDWRAEAAQDFYRATGAAPGLVVRRRHVGMRGRTVVGVEDEVLDVEQAAHPDRSDQSLVLAGEGALMAALAEHRTGHMRDIVSTIQAEQDAIIRAPLPGVLVVQGGPGTGKTAVALHRAAYLLYHHRDRLARTGVLVVGPNPLFLRYIEQVLPSLGETAVVLTTVAELVPGLEVSAEDSAATAALKGDPRMARVVRDAVALWQRVPPAAVPLDVDGRQVVLRPGVVAQARDRARRSGRPHNRARDVFARHVLDDLVRQLARASGVDAGEHRAELLAELHDAPDVRREVNLCWLPLTPQRLVSALLTDPEVLGRAGARLRPAERDLLLRDRSAGWTVADVPLVDEAADLLGDDDAATRLEARRRAAERAADVRYAQQVLDTGGGGGLVSAEQLADRFAVGEGLGSVAERAVADRTWTYGHVVVDEAQELSPMAWRALLRRCPSRSMTVVGDTAQTSSPSGASTWADVLERLVPGRWEVAELTVNYRTPAQVMAVAAQVLADHGVPARPPRAARSGLPPVLAPVDAVDEAAVARVVVGELEVLGAGRLAVLTPRRGYDAVRTGLRDRFGPASGSGVPGSELDASVVVLDVGAAKGLEFDSVVLLEPADVVDQSPRGAGDLYVALTRCTQRLTVVHARALPAALRAGGRPAEAGAVSSGSPVQTGDGMSATRDPG